MPLLAYTVFGASRQLGIGPTVLNSLAISSLLESYQTTSSGAFSVQRSVQLATVLTGMTGLIQAGLGGLRAGVLVGFLAKPLVQGLKTGVAAVVIVTQMVAIVDPHRATTGAALGSGLPVWLRAGVLPSLGGAGSAALSINPVSVATAVVTGFVLAAVWILYRRRSAGLVIAAVLASAIVLLAALGRLTRDRQHVVGDLSGGLAFAAPALDQLSLDDLPMLAPGAFLWAAVNNYLLNGNAELTAVGLSNLIGSFFRAHPVSASLDRSALNAGIGSLSPMVTGFAGLVALLCWAVASQGLAALPLAALHAVTIASSIPLVHANIAGLYRAVRFGDRALWGVSALATCLGGVDIGFKVACVSSLILITSKIARPNFAIVGRVPGTTLYRDISRHSGTILPRGIVPLRFDSPIHFGNAQRFRDIVDQVCGLFPEMRVLILDMTVIYDIDASGLEALENVVVLLRQSGKELHLCGPRGPMRDFLRQSGFISGSIPEANVWASLAPCVEAIAATL
jgi:SulP family sulfate permease